MAQTDEVVDGRVARSARTRAQVLAALEGLIRAGDPRPTAQSIATAAGVSTRSVYVHFSSLEDLHRAMTDKVRRRVIDEVDPIDEAQPLPARIRDLCRQRRQIHDIVGPLRHAASLQVATSPSLKSSLAGAREASRAQLAEVFAPELDSLDEVARSRLLGALDAMVAADTWDLLHGSHGMDPDEALETVIGGVEALLAHAVGERGSPG